MLPSNIWNTRPKSLEAIEQAIFNNAPITPDIKRYLYRKEFGLTAEELDNEPIEEFFLNWQIYAWIKKKEALEASHG